MVKKRNVLKLKNNASFTIYSTNWYFEQERYKTQLSRLIARCDANFRIRAMLYVFKPLALSLLPWGIEENLVEHATRIPIMSRNIKIIISQLFHD
jgi:hypothetical protein